MVFTRIADLLLSRKRFGGFRVGGKVIGGIQLIWLEVDSSYVVTMLLRRDMDVPGCFKVRWLWVLNFMIGGAFAKRRSLWRRVNLLKRVSGRILFLGLITLSLVI